MIVLLSAASLPADAQPAGVDPAVMRQVFARPERGAPPGIRPEDRDKVLLGRRLFSDPRLSGDGRRSCASCHRPDLAFTDGRPRAEGRSGAALTRNTPHLFNLAWGRLFYWDGRAVSLEAQARVPILAPDEMGGSFDAIISRVSADGRMRRSFARAFPSDPRVSETNILAALASYQRTLVAPLTRFDRFIAGDRTALTGQEREGLGLFVGRGQCVTCHGGWRLTDDKFHDIGIDSADPGRGAIPGGVPGLPAFKTPSLRLASRTSPYMHNGSLLSLEAVVDHYSDRVVERPGLATNVVRGLRLTADQKRALVAFLKTL